MRLSDYVFTFVLCFSIISGVLSLHIPQAAKIITALDYAVTYFFTLLLLIEHGRKVSIFEWTLFLVLVLCQLLALKYSGFKRYDYVVIWFCKFYMFYACQQSIFYNPRAIIINLKILSYVGIASALFAFFFQFNQGVFTFRNSSNFSIGNQFSSIWKHRNTFGGVLVSAFFASSCLILFSSRKKTQIYALALISLALLFTFSRSCYLAVFGASVVFIVLRTRNNLILAVSALLLCSICVLCYFVVGEFQVFVEKYMIRSSSGMTGREILWNDALSLLKDNYSVLFGWGVGFDRYYLKQYENVGGSIGFHSIYLTLLVNGGIVMLTAYLFMIWRVLACVKSRCNSITFHYYISVYVGYSLYLAFEPAMIFSRSPVSMALTYFLFVFPFMSASVSRCR